jgi:hypothetical protein
VSDKSTWSSLEPVYTDLAMVSARLDALVQLLQNGYDKDIDASAVPGLTSIVEREQREVERLSSEIEGILQTLHRAEGVQP